MIYVLLISILVRALHVLSNGWNLVYTETELNEDIYM